MKPSIHVRTFDGGSRAACDRVQLVRRRAATGDEHDAPNKRRVRAVRDGLMFQRASGVPRDELLQAQ